LATILGVSAAIVLNEHFLSDTLHAGLRKVGLHNSRYAMHWPDRLEYLVKLVIQLLAAIPSVVYGLWGIFVVIPWLRGVLARFEITLAGPSVLPASLVLAIMILPTITSIALDALKLVPSKARDAAHGLGATRWQALRTVVLPMASPGIVAGVLLGFGRALGETMALAMLSGNANVISYSVLQPANTLAALLANNFPEATNFQVSVLMVAALVLFTITICVNTLGNIVLMRANRLASRS
jgi:phosphate transport system permease protein